MEALPVLFMRSFVVSAAVTLGFVSALIVVVGIYMFWPREGKDE